MEQLKRIDTVKLYAPFVGLLAQLMANLQDRGTIFFATSGFRSVEEQDGLYARGRTAPGGVVTNARGGYSAHNYGVGVDLTRDIGDQLTDGLQPDYVGTHYDVLGEEARKVGLEWGGDWKSIQDRPHVQLPLKSRGLGWDALLALYHAGSIGRVWAELDKSTW